MRGKRVSVAGGKRNFDTGLVRTAIRDGEHFHRRIDPRYPRAATRHVTSTVLPRTPITSSNRLEIIQQ